MYTYLDIAKRSEEEELGAPLFQPRACAMVH